MATKKKSPSLAIGRGEKLPVSKGAGLTAKGRAKYNRETGSNLKAPQPEGGPRKKSFWISIRSWKYYNPCLGKCNYLYLSNICQHINCCK